MYDIYPFITNDGSIGLYNKAEDDIYHSVTGAVEEAYLKFSLPSLEAILNSNDEIKVLDICYGIGYNSKTFLAQIFENDFKNFSKINFLYNKLLSEYNDKIYSDNTKQINKKCSNVIYSDKNLKNLSFLHEDIRNKKFLITAIDNDKNLAFLSPFFKNKKFSIFNKKCHEFKNQKINKYKNIKNFEKDRNIKNFKILIKNEYSRYESIISYFILLSIIEQYPEITTNENINSILANKLFIPFFDTNITHFYKSFNIKTLNNTSRIDLFAFLHNIYYKYISNRYKKRLKCFKIENFAFQLKLGDARDIIKSSQSSYNIVFLDAFTPSKCPQLWTYDFFKLLYSKLENNGVLLTYSTSAPVRNALIKSGFYIGNIYNPILKKFTGTIAAKNKSLIHYPLNNIDLELLNTRTGIVYRDINLTLNNSDIIRNRELDIANSKLQTASKFKKNNIL